MTRIIIDNSKIVGLIKPMHSVNNGPASRICGDRESGTRGNFNTFSALGIPYVRNHDASLSEAYGSQHLVDVHCIFTDFSRNVCDESAYDFKLTDIYTKNILDTGAKVFYRLGASIEHWAQKYGTVVPSDFEKWAQICEHIIMHYNEGWANGFNYNIEYWEIWNEPDLDPDECENKRTWGGTRTQFFDFYEAAAKHLKVRFPKLKIGGPALAGDEDWAAEFLPEMQKRSVPIDFFSWHIYTQNPNAVAERAERLRKMLDSCGYVKAECICNEWNYVNNWAQPLEYIGVIKGIKGAAFAAAVMLAAQNCKALDKLMYYDARVEKIWNGLFDSDTLLPLKGYYSLKMFSELYKLKNQIECVCDDKDIYAVSASDGDKNAVMLAYYTDDENTVSKDISIECGCEMECFVLNSEKDCEAALVTENAVLNINMEPNTVIMLVSK